MRIATITFLSLILSGCSYVIPENAAAVASLLNSLTGVAIAQTAGETPATSTTAALSTSPDPTVPYFTAQSITLTSDAGGSTIHYTTDGSDPTCASLQYSSPIALAAGTKVTIKCIACENSTAVSSITTVDYIVAPVFIGNYVTSGSAQGVDVVGNYAYVAASAGLEIVDVSNPASPVAAGNVGTPGTARQVHVVGNYAYIADNTTLQIADISNPASPNLVGSVGSIGDVRDVEVSGTHAYIADYGGQLRVVDVSNPLSPSAAGSFNFRTSNPPLNATAEPLNLSISGNVVMVADRDGDSWNAVDISTPTTPNFQSNFGASNRAVDVKADGNYAYGVRGGPIIFVIDISNPASMSLAGSISPGGGFIRKIEKTGDYVYAAVDGVGMRIIDVSDPTTPALAATYTGLSGMGQVTGVRMVGKYAYLTNGANGLYIVQVLP